MSRWLETSVCLPAGLADVPGPIELWKPQVGIADAMGDPAVEIVTVVKPTRVGFTTLLTGIVGNYCVNDPCNILFYQPTEDDARDYMVSEVEPTFEASPSLNGVLSGELDERGRNTLLQRRFPGGSLKVLAAKSPRNFRRHSARVVIFDEADAMEVTDEGSPIDLGIKRADSFRDRKILIGSTPTHVETSNVLRSYATSSMSIFEVPCPECGAYFELLWAHIKWDRKQPHTARAVCPHCKAEIAERHKASMVAGGEWRSRRPEIVRHAGFKFNALVSLLPNTTWAHLAEEWLAKYKDPDTRQVFVNTRMAEGWREDGEDFDPKDLKNRVEPALGVDPVAADALLLTAGVDVQHDRIEVTTLGHGRPLHIGDFQLPVVMALAHEVVWGKPEDDNTWAELDQLLMRKFKHALGGTIRYAAVAVDSGNWADQVYEFCFPRQARHVMAIKGMNGFSRPAILASKSKIKAKSGLAGRLWIVGTDVMKQRILSRMRIPSVLRFSTGVLAESPGYFDQLTAETKVLHYVMGQPKHMFQRKRGQAAEALDCMVYGWAALETLHPNWDALETALKEVVVAKAGPKLAGFAKALHARASQ